MLPHLPPVSPQTLVPPLSVPLAGFTLGPLELKLLQLGQARPVEGVLWHTAVVAGANAQTLKVLVEAGLLRKDDCRQCVPTWFITQEGLKALHQAMARPAN